MYTFGHTVNFGGVGECTSLLTSGAIITYSDPGPTSTAIPPPQARRDKPHPTNILSISLITHASNVSAPVLLRVASTTKKTSSLETNLWPRHTFNSASYYDRTSYFISEIPSGGATARPITTESGTGDISGGSSAIVSSTIPPHGGGGSISGAPEPPSPTGSVFAPAPVSLSQSSLSVTSVSSSISTPASSLAPKTSSSTGNIFPILVTSTLTSASVVEAMPINGMNVLLK